MLLVMFSFLILIVSPQACWLSTFVSLRQKVLEACRRKGRIVQSIPRPRTTLPGEILPAGATTRGQTERITG